MIKVSVIIPVYNVEDYIEQCIESVINQTLKEIEIIIVNDGTKDNSIKKIEKYLSDSRVILINKENGGASSARNAGLKIAKGEYISFIDSDDFIEPVMLEELYLNAQEADIIFSDAIIFNEKKKEKRKLEYRYWKNINYGEGKVFWGKVPIVPWGKIYKKDFLDFNNIKFEEGIINEDILFTFKIMLCAKEVRHVKKIHYYYREDREGSVMNTATLEKNRKSFATIVKECEKINFKNDFEKFRIYIWSFYWKMELYTLEKKVISKEEINNFKNEVQKYSNYNYTTEEIKLLKFDMKRLFDSKQLNNINIFDTFYWKNKFFKKSKLKKILIYKGSLSNSVGGKNK